MIVGYDFDRPEVLTYKEEIFAMPFDSLLASIGGNLGLFIGFSISGVVTSLLLYISSKCHNFMDKGTF